MEFKAHGKHLKAIGRLSELTDLYSNLPGKGRWKGEDIILEASAENILHLVDKFSWLEGEKIEVIERMMKVQRDLEATRKIQLVPPEASSYPFKTKPFQHQLHAFGLSRHSEFFGLFMEMGTGKTKILIDTSFSLYSEDQIDAVLVLAPMGVHQQWILEQIPLHASGEWTGMSYYSGMNREDGNKWESLVENRESLVWFCMAFESLMSKKALEYIERILSQRRCMWILDESHMIKNPSAKRTKFILKHWDWAKYRRISTGTPLTQGLEDTYTQLKFLNPDISGHSSYYTFLNRYCKEIALPGAHPGATMIVGYKNVDELKRRLVGCTYQVLKKDCLDLPEKVYKTQYVSLTSEQVKLYKQMKKDLVVKLDSGEIVSAPLAITQLIKLQQIICGFISDGSEHHPVPTLRPSAVVDLVSLSKTAVVWCRFQHDVFLLERELSGKGFRCGTYHGATPEKERSRVILPGEVDVLIANPKSAGSGLNLTHFNTAIYYSNSFDAGERWQSEDRIHRIGQKHPCVYIDLVSLGTLDVKLLQVLQSKKQRAHSMKDIRYLLEED